MTKTIIRRPSNETSLYGDSLHPVLSKIYAGRKVSSTNELELSLARLIPTERLKGIDVAVDVLVEGLKNQKCFLIVGDFDADGATSSALSVRALRMLGAQHVDYLVPNRFEYGYGLTPEIVEVASELKPDILITVDNGISSIEGVRAARAHGMQVVVTDHHLPGAELPDADAIVNPNQSGDDFPSKNLAGVGVIFYVMLALRARLRTESWFEKQEISEPNLAILLDLVALGTVADVVPLDYNNRILVDQGLRRIRAGKCCPGISALLEIGKRQQGRVVASDLGFSVGPRLNAAGRLDDMSLGIECLLTDDPQQAHEFAGQLNTLNSNRREIEDQMREQAMADLNRLHLDASTMPYGLCIFDDTWHQGVIGILAARIKEQFHRPVIAFALTGDGDIKGSARSIPGFHIRDALDAVAARHPELIQKFGGHAMAAGLSLAQENLEAFQQAFDEEVRRHLAEDDLRGVIHSDGMLDEQDLGLDLAEQLREAGPWGQGFPEPVFDGEFEVISQRIVGEKHLKMMVRPLGGSVTLDAIAFNVAGSAAEQFGEGELDEVSLAYRLDVNEFRGIRSAQLMVEHINVLESEACDVV
ncbi:MAG: single-stranded-DNA-specific exonuclease RecJ [Gammaproteobacteria bacterium]|nr:single-stranded-DNA-specific exonuclease RecJ [Gammaproteobacteria bacterium]